MYCNCKLALCIQYLAKQLRRMATLGFAVQGLSSYLMVISILGTITEVWNFVASTSVTIITPNNVIVSCNGTYCSNMTYQVGQANLLYQKQQSTSSWNEVLVFVELFYEMTFPVIIPIYSKDLNCTDINLRKALPIEFISKLHRNPGEISTSALLSTLLPSFFLFKGAFQLNYSNCKFWYYTQVGSLLLSCLKMVLLTLLDLWDVTTNGILISVLFGLSQLWLVQLFMEKLGKQKKNRRHTKSASQVPTLDDFEYVKIFKNPEG